MAFKAADPSNHLYLCRFDGTSWTGNQVIQTDHGMPSSSDSPTLALYNGALIMTFKANDASNELYAARYDGANWTGNQPIQTDHGTAVSPLSPWMVSLDGELMMLFKGNDSDYIYLAALLSSGWHGNERLSRTTPISPMTNASGAIAALGKRRIMVFKAADSTQIYQAECLDSCERGCRAMPRASGTGSPAATLGRAILLQVWEGVGHEPGDLVLRNGPVSVMLNPAGNSQQTIWR